MGRRREKRRGGFFGHRRNIERSFLQVQVINTPPTGRGKKISSVFPQRPHQLQCLSCPPEETWISYANLEGGKKKLCTIA